MQVWTMVSGKAAVIASGIGGRPGPRWGRASCRRLQPVHDGDQDVLDAPVAQLVHHRQPELGAFVVGDPEAQNLAFTIPGDAQGDVNGLVFDHPTVGVADLHAQSVENDDRIHPVQRPMLPLPDLVQHGIGDAADQVGRDPQAVKILQMSLDVAH